ncbi:beta-N-acetylhexosaminidase [Oxalobacteraceae bacterium GrIS 1.18]
MNMEISIRKKIGQLFMVGFDALEVNEHITRMIQHYHVGGVILFRRNVDSPEQLARLCRELQEVNARVSDKPLLIAIDQEGGMVMRVNRGVTPIPSAMAFQEAGSVDDCEQLSRISAEEMRQLGINMNLAPVLDVNNNPNNPVIGVRAYGEDPDTVIAYGMAALRGIEATGLVATVKHFPGHGDTASDSHYSMPVVPHDRERLNRVELPPFIAAIEQGVPAIMTAHVVFPAIEPQPDLPATLSKAVLTGLLREELGFHGVIITDCLEMAAIAEGVGVSQGAVATLQAGADIVLVSHLEQRQAAALEAVINAVESGAIALNAIDDSFRRVQALKTRDAITGWRNLPAVPQGLMQPDALQLAARVQKAALRVKGSFRPLQKNTAIALITVEMRSRTEVDEVVASERSSLLPGLLNAGFEVVEYILAFDALESESAAALAFAAKSQQIIIQTYNATISQTQQALLAALPHDRLWLVAGRLPYDLDLVPDAQGRLASFGCQPAALLPVVERLISS